MNGNYLLSICIPTYNREEHLKRQVDYLLSEGAYEDDRIQMVISDNHSDDGTKSYLEALSMRCPEIVVNRNETNLGLARNLFVCSQLARGKFIWIVGDDDQIFPGTVHTVLELLEAYPDIGHLFLNHIDLYLSHSDKIKGKKEFVQPTERILYSSSGGYFEDGFEMFRHLTLSSRGFGMQMFITGNIYRAEMLKEANAIFLRHKILDNLALPLGYSLYCSKLRGYAVAEVFVKDSSPGFSSPERLVGIFSRDIIEICDVVGTEMGRGDEIRKLIVQVYKGRCPEFEYMVRGWKYREDNYAMKMYWRHFPREVVLDFFRYPVYVLKRVFRDMKLFVLGRR